MGKYGENPLGKWRFVHGKIRQRKIIGNRKSKNFPATFDDTGGYGTLGFFQSWLV